MILQIEEQHHDDEKQHEGTTIIAWYPQSEDQCGIPSNIFRTISVQLYLNQLQSSFLVE